jgi:glucuronosyltransferase
MTFTERFFNTINTLIEKVFYDFYHLPNQRRLYEKYFPNAEHSFYDAYKNSSVIFINNNVVTSSPRPFVPQMIDIGGIHVSQPKPLKNNLQKFLDSASDGVILFSMGSIMQGTDWEEEQREAFIAAFSELKEKVLWKYENETLPNKPANVRISKWLPQSDILAHENVRLFITHGGLLGVTEAVVHGVPILAIPMFGDQKMNAANAVARGYGLQLDAENLTREKISKTLNELLIDKKYQENAKLVSAQFKDRPTTPKLSVVRWTEYVVRHRGAPHLKVAGNELGFIALHSCDVYFSMIIISAVMIFSTFSIVKRVCKKFFVMAAHNKIKSE